MSTELVPSVTTTVADFARCVLPVSVSAVVQRLIEDGVHRMALSTTRGERLLEIALAAPMSPSIVLRVLDAVDAVAASASGPVMIDTRPAFRRTYRGGTNWVTRARLRTQPSRLQH